MIRRAGFLALLATQGLWASRRTPRLPPAEGPADGAEGSGRQISLLALGDSIVAGVGVTHSGEALPACLARELAQRGGLRLRWRACGFNGARSPRVLTQIQRCGSTAPKPDLVLISNGINDVTTTRPEAAVLCRLLDVVDAAERRFPGSLVCQLGLPPLGLFPALPQPLRRVLGGRAGRIDRALGERLASRPATLHLPFDQVPDERQFAPDGYHPDAAGVAAWAEALAPRILFRLVNQPEHAVASPVRNDDRKVRAP